MLPESDNLTWLDRGTRLYGKRPLFPRVRNYWEFQWIFKGSPWQSRPDRDSKPGLGPCIHISHPDSMHGWEDKVDNSCDIYVMHARSIPGELLVRVESGATLLRELSENEAKRHRMRLDELWHMREQKDERLMLKMSQLLIEVALLVLGRPVVSPEPWVDRRVELALHWFEENIGHNPSVVDMARAVGVSPAHLRRLFEQEGRASPKQELARIRMQAVQRCLRAGWSLERIAQYLGFSEASALSRAFRDHFGISPKVWREAGGR